MLPTLILVFAALLISMSSAWPDFRNMIPNGNKVPNPCGGSANNKWSTVGHAAIKVDEFSGLNQFGADFLAAGRAWITELCKEDSDGDGKTNGEELGDPNCTWTPGATPTRTTDLSHPGICEPVTSEACRTKNDFLTSNNCQALVAKQSSDLNPWELSRNCTCFCLNHTGYTSDMTHKPQFHQDDENDEDRDEHDDFSDEVGDEDSGEEDDEEDAASYEYDFYQDPDDIGFKRQKSTTPKANHEHHGRNHGGRQHNEGDDDGEAVDYEYDFYQNPGDSGFMRRKPSTNNGGQGEQQQQQRHETRDHRHPSPLDDRHFIAPPLSEAAEFNKTDTYNIKVRCTCACPKA